MEEPRPTAAQEPAGVGDQAEAEQQQQQQQEPVACINEQPDLEFMQHQPHGQGQHICDTAVAPAAGALGGPSPLECGTSQAAPSAVAGHHTQPSKAAVLQEMRPPPLKGTATTQKHARDSTESSPKAAANPRKVRLGSVNLEPFLELYRAFCARKDFAYKVSSTSRVGGCTPLRWPRNF